MDEDLTFKKPERVTVEEAATIGVGLLVSILVSMAGIGTIFDINADSKSWRRNGNKC